MRKEDITSLVIYLIMIAAAIIVGLTAIQDAVNKFRPDSPFLLVLLTLIIGLLVNVILLEVFHVIGAKMGGYKVIAFNVLGICLLKKGNKWELKFRDFDGLTGETKIAPDKEKLNLKPYVWLPIFGYAAEIAGMIVLYTQINKGGNPENGWLAISAILMIVISSMIALYNLVPLKLDSMTDGYRMILLSKPVNTEAYNELLRVQKLECEGKEVDSVKVFEEVTEFTATLNLVAVYHNLSKDKFDEAEKIIDLMLENPKKIDPKDHKRLIAQKLYIQLLTKDVEVAKETYDKLANDETRRFFANDVTTESIRSYVLISGLIEGSLNEVKFAKSRIEKARKKVMPSRLKVEDSLYEKAIHKVLEVHPEWEKENIAA